MKAEEAFGILIAREVVDKHVRSLPLLPVPRAVYDNFLLTSKLIVTFPVPTPPSLGIGIPGLKRYYYNL